MKKNKKFKSRVKRGFTLVEMLVSITVFMVVITVSSGLFVSAVKVQQDAFADQKVISQTSYALNYMSRALRMAKKDTEGDCITKNLNYEKTSNGIKFKDYEENCREFFLSNGQIKQNLNGEVLPLTSDKLEVVNFNIALKGEDQTSNGGLDHLQPRATLFLEVKEKGQDQTKIFQTTVSQRNLDIYK